MQIESITNGDIKDYAPKEIFKIIERLVNTSSKWYSIQEELHKSSDSYDVVELSNKVDFLLQHFSKKNVSTIISPLPSYCELFRGNHKGRDCDMTLTKEQCNFLQGNHRGPSKSFL